ncbi:MAG: acyltransferase family protein [Bacteroidota bacterium]
MTRSQPYYPALTGIRAVAAFMVFAHHFNPVAVASSPFLHHLINELHIGVSVFFVLSGFLITMRYSGSAFSWQQFMSYVRNRIARIYPLYFFLTTATFIYLWALSSSGTFDVAGYLMNISLLKGFLDNWKFSGIAQSWSLTVEECFYLLVPLILLLRKRVNWILMPIALLLLGFFATWCRVGFDFEGLFNNSHFFLVYTFAGRSFEFFIGMQLAFLVKEQTEMRKGMKFTAGGILAVAACLTAMAWVSMGHTVSLDTAEGIMLNNIVLPILVALFFYGLLREETFVSTLLSTSPMQWLGKSSYAFYLVHLGFIQLLLQEQVTLNPLMLFVLLNAVALALYFLVERPLHVLLRVNAQGEDDR